MHIEHLTFTSAVAHIILYKELYCKYVHTYENLLKLAAYIQIR